MGADVRVAEREHDEQGADQAATPMRGPAQHAARQAARPPAGRPERHQPEPEQDHSGAEGQQAREVVARRADLRRVVHGLDAGDDPEDADQQRDRSASPAAARAGIRGRRQPSTASGTRPLTR